MTKSEPTFAVPLSKLYTMTTDGFGAPCWQCLLASPQCGSCLRYAPSESEARSAAIAHLAEVHGITVLVEETRYISLRSQAPTGDKCPHDQDSSTCRLCAGIRERQPLNLDDLRKEIGQRTRSWREQL